MVFLQSDYNLLSLKTLRCFCKNKKIKYSNLNKKDLFNEFNKYLAVKCIQFAFRKYFYKNAIDHITMDSVCYPCFIFKTKLGKCYFYEYSSIIKYIMKTGDTRDPMTRINYSNEDLLRLDIEAKKHFPNNNTFKSTYKIKNNINYSRRIRNRENEILSFQTRLDELKNNLMFVAEFDICSWEIDQEPILIDNVMYNNLEAYINSVLYELNVIFNHFRRYDPQSSSFFKINLIESIQRINNESNLIEKIEKM